MDGGLPLSLQVTNPVFTEQESKRRGTHADSNAWRPWDTGETEVEILCLYLQTDREGEEAALREEKQEQKWEIRSERNESVPYRCEQSPPLQGPESPLHGGRRDRQL